MTSIAVKRLTKNRFEINVQFDDPTLGLFPADLLDQPADIQEQQETWNEEYTIDNSDDPQQVKNTAGEPWIAAPSGLRATGFFASRNMSLKPCATKFAPTI